MSLFGPPKIERMLAKHDVKGLINALNYQKDEKVRLAAADALFRSGALATEPLIAALKHVNESVRATAADLLGKLGDERAIEPLLASLKDRSVMVGLESSLALVKIGSPAVQPLIDLINDKDIHVQERAISALGGIKDIRSVEPLIAALSDSKIKIWVIIALGKIGDIRAVMPLIEMLNSIFLPDFMQALTAISQSSGEIGVLAEALGNLGDIRAVEPLMAAFYNTALALVDRRDSYQTNFRCIIVDALKKISGPNAVEFLVRVLNNCALSNVSPGPIGLAHCVAIALGEIGDANTAQALKAFEYHRWNEVRMRQQVQMAISTIEHRK